MAGQFEECNVKNTLVSESTFSIKEENDFVENKVHISETAISIGNTDLQVHIQCDNIKREVLLSEIQNDIEDQKIKTDEGVSADVIKMEFDNLVLYCEECCEYYEDYCKECRMLECILNKNTPNNAENSIQKLPDDILEIQNRFEQFGIYALKIIPAGVKFGPFTGLTGTECVRKIRGGKFIGENDKSKYQNWMQHINPAKNNSEQNLSVFQCQNQLYYQSTCQIQEGDELLVYFGEEYEDSLNTNVAVDFIPTTDNIMKDVFACSFCCLGFNSKTYLAKHKTVCHVAVEFSIEELAQCPYCKIHLGQKEYIEHHKSYCERNERNCTHLTATNHSVEVKRRKICRQQSYRWQQSKLRTIRKANLNQVKTSKCDICYRRFKTKESFRLHVENAHIYVDVKAVAEHSNVDRHIKVEQPNAKGQMKRFKCSLCGFRTKYKQHLRNHIKTKHLKEFDYECDKCEFRTNHKISLEKHIKTKHLKEFDYECDSCEFKTNQKDNLEYHIKTKHLMKFDFECDKCEFRTNNKAIFLYHVKAKHLMKFNHKCDKCEFRTKFKIYLKRHIKTKHLKEFDYKCDKCDFGTNNSCNFFYHIKAKHLKEFNHKCDKCEFGTNRKNDFEKHMKTKHLKEFDYKCDKCEYRTNKKTDLVRHVKAIHLKEFSLKCDKCEFRTNEKSYLKKHIKTQHLKEFDFECESCEFRSNRKYHLKVHIQRKHLEEIN